MEESQDRIKCPNCENEYSSKFNYCPYCSQKNIDTDPKLIHFFSEFLSANFNLDSKIFITIKSLLLKPAELSKEFMAGKREKYITPVKLYLFISLIYFFILSGDFSDKSQAVEINGPDTVAADSSDISITIDDVEPDTLKGFDKILYHKLKVMKTPAGKKVLMEKFNKNISLGMFVFIPFTAFLFFILFRSRIRYYLPNLIFTLHLQSLLFLWFIVFNIIGFMFDYTILDFAKILFIIYIIFRWIKSFYKTTTFNTIWRMILFFGTYFVFLLIYLGTIMGISMWFID